MPLPEPGKNEKSKDFMSRCMDDETMKSEYPKQNQRAAVCYSQLRGAGRDVPGPKKKGK